MACNCHGKKGVSTSRTSPYDQCTVCAKKHIVKAWNLFNEFTYTDDNRDVISGQLRNAADHLKDSYRDTALKVRDLAIIIEEARDAELSAEWDETLRLVREHFYAEHPDIRQRLSDLES